MRMIGAAFSRRAGVAGRRSRKINKHSDETLGDRLLRDDYESEIVVGHFNPTILQQACSTRHYSKEGG
jgi:hypothetical protein